MVGKPNILQRILNKLPKKVIVRLFMVDFNGHQTNLILLMVRQMHNLLSDNNIFLMMVVYL